MTSVKIPVGSVELNGELVLPPAPSGIVLFAHGSGSSRLSPRNTLPIGYFGASTGAAAALQAAAEMDGNIAAVVSRGGRPDLAGEVALGQVIAPTLLIVGSADYDVIELNEQAYALMKCEKKLTLVPGATHLFDEPGTLKEAAQHATNWFIKYLS